MSNFNLFAVPLDPLGAAQYAIDENLARLALFSSPPSGFTFTISGGADAGAVRLFHGGSVPGTVGDATAVIVGAPGDAITSAAGGDIDGDGYDDLLIGAPGADLQSGGAAYVFFGTGW